MYETLELALDNRAVVCRFANRSDDDQLLTAKALRHRWARLPVARAFSNRYWVKLGASCFAHECVARQLLLLESLLCI